MNNIYIIGGMILAGAICIFGLIYSIYVPRHHDGETDEIRSEPIRKHRVLLNFHFLPYIFFGIFALLVIGYFAWFFKGTLE